MISFSGLGHRPAHQTRPWAPEQSLRLATGWWPVPTPSEEEGTDPEIHRVQSTPI